MYSISGALLIQTLLILRVHLPDYSSGEQNKSNRSIHLSERFIYLDDFTGKPESILTRLHYTCKM
jgi:hypothetical protein